MELGNFVLGFGFWGFCDPKGHHPQVIRYQAYNSIFNDGLLSFRRLKGGWEVGRLGGWRLEAGGWRLEKAWRPKEPKSTYSCAHIQYYSNQSLSLVLCLCFNVILAFWWVGGMFLKKWISCFSLMLFLSSYMSLVWRL